MSYSLNEVEAVAKKAARGAGHAWGIAEEAGKATRWLCRHDLDGCAALARLLVQFDSTDASGWRPQIRAGEWTATCGALCPLFTGAALSDRAQQLSASEVRLAKVVEPVLLLFFAAMAAQQLRTAVKLAWSGTVAATDGARMSMDGNADSRAERVIVTVGGNAGSNIDQPNTLRVRAEPATACWPVLERFARRTYAPATEESRCQGAGAQSSNHG